MFKRISRKLVAAIFLLLLFVTPSLPQIFYQNKGNSKSLGMVSNGSIQNAWLLPRKGKNFKSFSLFSYYLLGRGFVHQQVYHSILDSYSELNSDIPDLKFRYMECSRKKGGQMFPHHTHQNGLSVDFMTPLRKKNQIYRLYDRTGLFRYLMNFDEKGNAKINSKIEIDFETMALHILTLQKAGMKNGVRIKKVIFKLDLKDELFATSYGSELKQSGIYFAKNLSPMLNKLHDDHYHIDFEIE